MLNRLFGNYLVNTGCLDQKQLNELLDAVNGYTAGLDLMVIINKLLTPAQIQLVQENRAQGESLADAALRLQLLTDSRIEKIQQQQKMPVMCFLQLLVDRQVIPFADIMRVISDFQSYQEFSDEQLRALCLDDMEQIIRIFVPFHDEKLHELTVTLFQTLKRLIDKNVYLDKAYMARSIQIDRYAAQSLTGDLNLKFYLSAPMNNLLGVANYFTEAVYETVDEDALDTVSEFINCVNGLFATNLSYEEVSLDMDAPEYGMEGPYLNHGTIYVIPIHANGMSFRAVLELHQ